MRCHGDDPVGLPTLPMVVGEGLLEARRPSGDVLPDVPDLDPVAGHYASPKNRPYPSLKLPSTGGSSRPGRLVEDHQIRHRRVAGSNSRSVMASSGWPLGGTPAAENRSMFPSPPRMECACPVASNWTQSAQSGSRRFVSRRLWSRHRPKTKSKS